MRRVVVVGQSVTAGGDITRKFFEAVDKALK
jgi:putative N-acetylmannosamine-6-phosphate epimerase